MIWPVGGIRAKKHRLPATVYRGPAIVSFTLCVAERRSAFVEAAIFPAVEGVLLRCLEKARTAAHVYLFMPDHCHLVLEGRAPKADIFSCVVKFKQGTGFLFGREDMGFRWQKGFYDHVLRRDEDVEKHVRYVLENPVRQGLVEDWRRYPFKGSTVYDFSAW